MSDRDAAVNEALGDFVRIIAHDLKAPLRAAGNLATWIEEDLGELPEDVREQMSLLHERLKGMTNLLEGLDMYLEAGKRRPVERTDVAQLLTKIIARVKAPESFEFDVGSTLPIIETVTFSLGEVFFHLIDNAVRHHGKMNGHVRVSATSLNNMIEFRVADDGQGIAESSREHVMRAFRKLTRHGGAGLGLALVRRMVLLQGGQVWFEPGQTPGTEICFTWPKECPYINQKGNG